MNQSSPTDDLRKTSSTENGDNLDRLLSSYFKSKMKQPWPAAPATPSRMSSSEPSVLVASRAAKAAVGAPRNQPASVGTSCDGGRKSRNTLAVSVAVLLGTCLYLSNSSQPGERVAPGGNNAPKVFNVIPDASAEKPAAIQQIQKDRAEQGDQGVGPGAKIQIP
ncbi:MAG TPA: hypothetical protein VG097_00990 [Gemmata sp.]|jgi:hypothetical protein|nr:hypothetical protein [Gemmata sp.]